MSRAGRVEREIPVAATRMDRWPLNPTTLALVDYLRTGGEVPAIKVQTVSGGEGGGWRILDGRHRVAAAKLLGRSTIRARFSTRKARRLPSD